MINRTRITKGAAVAYTAWVRRAAAHPEVAAALAGGEISESFARTICLWTDKLPEDCRPDADEILLGAARAGGTCGTWPGWPRRSTPGPCPRTPDKDRDEAFEDRSVRLETTFHGAGRADRGPDAGVCRRWWARCWTRCRPRPGRRTPGRQAQRCHDALQEAMRPLCFCIMMDSWTHTGRPGGSPAQGGRVRPPERDLRRGRVGSHSDRAGHRPREAARLGRRRPPSRMTGSPGSRKSPGTGSGS